MEANMNISLLPNRTSNTLIRHLYTVLALLLMSLLSSCAHVGKKDGPPNFYVDEKKVPNAVPKAEPLAKYGNYKTYWVFGKPYHTMASSKHYEAVGTASWYGTMFHNRKTSSGERYNMLGMTAAHKTLPLPTYVEVTNLRNHRKVIVKVNDRGPFSGSRLIDLSYVAAKKLGMLGHGTAHVKIRALNPLTYGHEDTIIMAQKNDTHHFKVSKLHSGHQIAAARPNSADRYFYLQVGAFRNKSHADRLQQRLETLVSAPVKVAHPMANGRLYRVQIGPFKDVASASRITHRLKNLGIKSNKTYGA